MGLRISLGECFLHAAIIALPFAVLVVLGVHRLAPGGTFAVSAGTLERSPYINRILPAERAVANDDDGSLALIADPAYFSVTLPEGAFTSVDVALEYRNHGQPIFELGALTDVYAQSYDLRPVENRLIDESVWQKTRVGDRVLLQRTPEFASIEAFLANPPARSRIATYHDELTQPYRDPAYVPLGAVQTFDASLRGYHKLVTYIKNEDLAFTFRYMDMNRTAGADEGVVRVWNEADEIVYEQRFTNDGNSTDNQISSPPTTINVTGQGWSEGVYAIELSGTSDIFWRQIVTTQRYATFVNRLYVGDDVGHLAEPRPTTFYTDAKHFTFETFHADSPQAVQIGRTTIPLPASHEKVQQSLFDKGVVLGRTPVGDIKITGEGLFAFSESSFFNPYPARLTVNTDIEALGIDFILASYTEPAVLDGEWREAKASFTLDGMAIENGALKFILSAPNIAVQEDSIDIRRVTVAFYKPPLTLRSTLALAWHAVTPW